MNLSLAIWNTEWATPGSKRESRIKQILAEIDADILCITEGYLRSWENEGYVISSEEDFGYRIQEGRRKAILVSKEPWSNIDTRGSKKLPPGRFCSGTTHGIDTLGVCIPWKSAHVTTGNKNRKVWEDHLSYLDGLGEVLRASQGPSMVMGDFNQRIPRKYSPEDVYHKLVDTFEPDYSIATSGEIQGLEKQAIDHLAISNSVQVNSIVGIPAVDNGQRLSDHDGLVIDIEVETQGTA